MAHDNAWRLRVEKLRRSLRPKVDRLVLAQRGAILAKDGAADGTWRTNYGHWVKGKTGPGENRLPGEPKEAQFDTEVEGWLQELVGNG